MKKMFKMGISLLLLVLSGFSAFADKYDDAVKYCDQFIEGYNQIRTINKEDNKALVRAMCEADDDARLEIGRRAAERVESDVRSNFDALKRTKENADQLIDQLKNDPAYRDKMEKLFSLQKRMNEIMPRLERMQERCRAGNNPVFQEMSRYGMEAHTIYQNQHSSEGVKEFPVSSGRIDFINWSTCACIEVKANNSSAISKGESQLKGYVSDLNTDKYYNKLLEVSSEAKQYFPKCKDHFVPKIVRYVYCPEIDDDGNLVSASLTWEN